MRRSGPLTQELPVRREAELVVGGGQPALPGRRRPAKRFDEMSPAVSLMP